MAREARLADLLSNGFPGAKVREPQPCTSEGCSNYTARQYLVFGHWMPDVCEWCARRTDYALTKTEEQSEAHEHSRRLTMLNIPRQYSDASFKGFTPYGSDAQKQATGRVVEMGKRYVRDWGTRHEASSTFAHLVVFKGENGTGKTRMCWTIARNIVQLHGASVLVTTLADMIRAIRATWKGAHESGSESAVLARYKSPELLIVDEASSHALYGAPTQHVYDVIAPREAAMKATIITTNDEDSRRIVGPAIADRVRYYGEPWDFGQESYRAHRGASLQ